jgi:hypothetical protein
VRDGAESQRKICVAEQPGAGARCGSGAAAAAPAAMAESDAHVVSFLRTCLLDSSLPVPYRWRAIFSLRNYKGESARQALIDAMSDDSNLLAHEAAFALGQMQDAEAISALRRTLEGVQEFHPIVRHEVLTSAVLAAEIATMMSSGFCNSITNP